MNLIQLLLIFFTIPVFSLCSFECNSTWINNGWCDEACMSVGCNFDGGDCASTCSTTYNCTLPSNNVCDPACDNVYCGYDHGDCGYCSDGCTLTMLEDSVCHEECNNAYCNFNNYKCDCNEGCKGSYIGDGTCQWECMTYDCSYDNGDCDKLQCNTDCTLALLKNNECDEVCNTETCNYDNYQCLCNTDCYPSMLTNGVCDKECAVADCDYDNHDCGDCALDCFKSAISNGTCDSVCNNADCNYDGTDCLTCANNCLVTDLGKCNSDCMVYSCGFDPNCHNSSIIFSAYYQQIVNEDWNYQLAYPTQCPYHDCSLKYTDSLNFLQPIKPSNCTQTCNFLDCYYNYFQCYSENCTDPNCKLCSNLDPDLCVRCNNYQWFGSCLTSCPKHYESYTHPQTNVQICVESADTTTEESPEEIFVSATNLVSGDGSINSPYISLSYALSTVTYKYATVYLMSGSHNLTTFDDSTSLEAKSSKPLYRDTTDTIQLLIKPLYCSIYSVSNCVDDGQSITVYVDAIPLSLDISTNVTIENIIFDGSITFAPHCADCNYCKSATNNDGQLLDDRGKPLLTGNYAPQDICNTFSNLGFFNITSAGILNLKNVKIQNFRQQYSSIISVNGGILNMESVNFYNFMSAFQGSAISSTCSSGYCGEIHYLGGTVSAMNNGYEITKQITLAPFLSATKTNYVEIQDIIAEKNIVQRTTNQVLFQTFGYFYNVLNITILNSEFRFNYNYDGLFYINQNSLVMPTTLDSDYSLIYQNLQNIRVENCTFYNNSAQTYAGFIIKFNKELQNIYFNNNTFYNNIGSEIIYIDYEGSYYSIFVSGESRVTTIDGKNIKIHYPKRTITFYNLNFTNNFLSETAIEISNVPNVNFLYSYWISNGESDYDDINTVNIDYLIDSSDLYISLELSSLDYTCSSILSISDTNNFIFDFNTVEGNFCSDTNAGLYLQDCIGSTYIQNSTFTKNKSQGNSIALFADMSTTPVIYNLTFTQNYFSRQSGNGVVVLNTKDAEFTLTKCKFISSQTPVYADSLKSLTIDNCTFESGAKDQFYSAVAFRADDSSSLTIIDSFIQNNSPTSGHIKIYSAVVYSSVLLSISNCLFYNNSLGSYLITIDNSIAMDSDSVITSSNFSSNAITLINAQMRSGSFTVSSSTFSSNSAPYGTILNSGCVSPTMVIFDSNTISSNTGDSIFYISSDSGTSLFYTIDSYVYNNSNNTISLHQGNWTDSGSTFYKNSGYQGGAALIESTSNAILTNTIFKSNSASEGGAIYLSGSSTLVCDNCTFSDNFSSDEAGALYSEQASKFTFNNSVITKNSCTSRGSAIASLNSFKVTSIIQNTEVSFNYAGVGAAITGFMVQIMYKNCSIYNNTSVANTPSILMIYSNAYIYDSKFYNHIGYYGAHIYADIMCILMVYDTSFENSVSESTGGSVSISGSLFYCERCYFNNTSAQSGGTTQCFSGSVCTFNYSTVENSAATSSGGVFFLFESSLYLYNSIFNGFVGSCVETSKTPTIVVSNSTFKNGINTYGAAIDCVNCVSVNITSSTFTDLKSTDGGALYFDYQSYTDADNKVTITDSVFNNCTAEYGGAIYSNKFDLDISGCTFENNYAGDSATACTAGEGGAVYLKSEDSINITISSSTFTNNSACISGGGIQWYDYQPVLSDLVYKNNSAYYGNNLASFPYSLDVIDSRRRLEVSVDSAPGQTISSPIIIGIMDHYNQTVLTESSSYCQLEVVNSTSYSLSGKTKVQAASGLYNFSDVIVTGDPGSNVEITVSSTIVSNSNLPSGNIVFDLRNCTVGEALVAKTCQVCTSGTYNLEAGTSCKDCPAEAKCYGKSDIYPLAGYWRWSNTTDDFLECPNSAACLGGVATNNSLGECETGYYGNLCQSCQSDYSRNGQDSCSKCPNPTINALILAAMLILAILIVFLMVRASIKSAFKPKSMTSVFIKIFMNYLQIVVLTASFNLDWPFLVLQFFSVQEQAGGVTDQIFSIDCYLQGENTKPFYSKLVFMALLPAGLFVITLIFWLGYYICVIDTKYIKNKFLGSLVVQLFLIHPTLVKYNFSCYNCYEVSPGNYYLRSDLDLKCWDSEHWSYSLFVAFPSIMVWCITVPALCLLHIYLNRDKLLTLELKLQYGFLYLGYKKETYYWEFTIIYRKILIICCAVFMGNSSTSVQALTVFFLLLTCFFVQAKIQPYLTDQLNILDLRAILVSGLTIYCGLFYLTGDIVYAVKIVLFIIIVVVNFYFLFYWASNMTGVGLAILYSKLGFIRRCLHGTKLENWLLQLVPAKIPDTSETELDKTFTETAYTKDNLDSPHKVPTQPCIDPKPSSRKLKRYNSRSKVSDSGTFFSEEQHKEKNDIEVVRYDEDSVKSLTNSNENAEEISIFERVPLPSLRDNEGFENDHN
ncbi:unnamed protein product [Blepharisma stoltei]|uniref:LNR domain-containing protein n=1 Tax=Blepharisma stoltei TaxID=1481888 RepID=A0AAU9JCK6_9CILI|nr:unnamed protein product [Blepharisma stoltei]